MELSDYRPVGTSGAYPPWIKQTKNTNGVYVIRSKRSKKALYVGQSQSKKLYNAMTRHFQSVGEWYWSNGKERPTYHRRDVEVAFIPKLSPSQTEEHEERLILELDPRDNTYETEPKDQEYEDEVPF
ncbi:MAG: hypothetical protein ACYSWP_14990 [Planctomycetota bacterium]|jgi:hypothetical protein